MSVIIAGASGVIYYARLVRSCGPIFLDDVVVIEFLVFIISRDLGKTASGCFLGFVSFADTKGHCKLFVALVFVSELVHEMRSVDV